MVDQQLSNVVPPRVLWPCAAVLWPLSISSCATVFIPPVQVYEMMLCLGSVVACVANLALTQAGMHHRHLFIGLNPIESYVF